MSLTITEKNQNSIICRILIFYWGTYKSLMLVHDRSSPSCCVAETWGHCKLPCPHAHCCLLSSPSEPPSTIIPGDVDVYPNDPSDSVLTSPWLSPLLSLLPASYLFHQLPQSHPGPILSRSDLAPGIRLPSSTVVSPSQPKFMFYTAVWQSI